MVDIETDEVKKSKLNNIQLLLSGKTDSLKWS